MASEAFTAASTCKRVVRSTGTGPVCCRDQQLDLGAAEHDAFGAGLGQADDGVAVDLPGLLPHDPDASLLVNDSMDLGSVLDGWDQHGEPAGGDPVSVEILLHRESGTISPTLVSLARLAACAGASPR